MKQNHNLNRIKIRSAYTFAEIAALLRIHVGTVHHWRKERLVVIDDQTRPFLIMGAELERFLKSKMAKRRHQLRADELFCPRCHLPRKAVLVSLWIEITARGLGKNAKQVIIRGQCAVCGQAMLRFSSNRQIPELIANGLPLTELPKGLCGSDGSPVNINIIKEPNS